MQTVQQPLDGLPLGEQAARRFGIGRFGAERVCLGAEANLLAGAAFAVLVADAVDDDVVGDSRKPAEEAAGRLVGETADIAEGAQTGFLNHVLRIRELPRARTELEVHQDSQAATVLFKNSREGLLVAILCLFEKVERGGDR